MIRLDLSILNSGSEAWSLRRAIKKLINYTNNQKNPKDTKPWTKSSCLDMLVWHLYRSALFFYLSPVMSDIIFARRFHCTVHFAARTKSHEASAEATSSPAALQVPSARSKSSTVSKRRQKPKKSPIRAQKCSGVSPQISSSMSHQGILANKESLNTELCQVHSFSLAISGHDYARVAIYILCKGIGAKTHQNPHDFALLPLLSFGWTSTIRAIDCPGE